MEELRQYVIGNSKLNSDPESNAVNGAVHCLSKDELREILEADTMSYEEFQELQQRAEKTVENDGQKHSCYNVLQVAEKDIKGLTVEARESFYSNLKSALSMNYKTVFKEQGSIYLTELIICKVAKKMEFDILSTANDLTSYRLSGAEKVVNIEKQTLHRNLYKSLESEIELLRLCNQAAQDPNLNKLSGTEAVVNNDELTYNKNPHYLHTQIEILRLRSQLQAAKSKDAQELSNDLSQADTEPFIFNESQCEDSQSNVKPVSIKTVNNKFVDSPDPQNVVVSESEYYSSSSDYQSCVEFKDNNETLMENTDIQDSLDDLPVEKQLEEIKSVPLPGTPVPFVPVPIVYKNNNYIEKVTNRLIDVLIETQNSNGMDKLASVREHTRKIKRKRKLECDLESSLDCSAIRQNGPEGDVDNPKKKQKKNGSEPNLELSSDGTIVADNSYIENPSSESHLKSGSQVILDKDKNVKKMDSVESEIVEIDNIKEKQIVNEPNVELRADRTVVTNENNVEYHVQACSNVILDETPEKEDFDSEILLANSIKYASENIKMDCMSSSLDPLYHGFDQVQRSLENERNSPNEMVGKTSRTLINNDKTDSSDGKSRSQNRMKKFEILTPEKSEIHRTIMCRITSEIDLSQYSLRIDDKENIDQNLWDNVRLESEKYATLDEVLSQIFNDSAIAPNSLHNAEEATIPSEDMSTQSTKKSKFRRRKKFAYCPLDEKVFDLERARLDKLVEEMKNRTVEGVEAVECNNDYVIHDDYKKVFGIILPIIRKYYLTDYIPNEACYGQILQRLQIDLNDANASDDVLASYVEDSIRDRRYLLDGCIVQ